MSSEEKAKRHSGKREPAISLRAFERRKFSIESGIAVQTSDLGKWKAIMSDEAFDELCKIVTKDNVTARDGYDIVRGCMIQEILMNHVVPLMLAKQSS